MELGNLESSGATLRRKYKDCQRPDGDCTVCSLSNYGRDCHNRKISNLEWYRRSSGFTQNQIASISGINIRLVQKIEGCEVEAGNLTARNLLAIADALNVDPHDLI